MTVQSESYQRKPMGYPNMKIIKEEDLLLPHAFLISVSDTLVLESLSTRMNYCLQRKKCPEYKYMEFVGQGGRRGR